MKRLHALVVSSSLRDHKYQNLSTLNSVPLMVSYMYPMLPQIVIHSPCVTACLMSCKNGEGSGFSLAAIALRILTP